MATAAMGRADGIGRLIRRIRGDQPAWQFAQPYQVSPDNLRDLEQGKRPMTELARTLLRALRVDTKQLVADLWDSLHDEVKGLPLEDQAIILDLALINARRFAATGKVARIRISEREQPAGGIRLTAHQGGKKGPREDPLNREAARGGAAAPHGRQRKAISLYVAGGDEEVRLEGFEPPTPSSGNWWDRQDVHQDGDVNQASSGIGFRKMIPWLRGVLDGGLASQPRHAGAQLTNACLEA